MDLLNHFKAIPAHLILSRLIWQFSVDDFYAPDSYVWSNPSSCPLEYLVQPYGFDLWNILDGFGWMNIWEYFGGSKPCKPKGQVKLGPWLKTKFYEDLWPLVYLGLIELSPFSPHVHRRQVFSTLVLIAPPQFYGVRATNDDRKLYRFNAKFDLNPIWNCWCMIGKHHFFNHLQITAPTGFFQFAMKSH